MQDVTKSLTLLMILTSFLSCVSSNDLKHRTIQCSPFFAYNGAGDIDLEASTCVCRGYEYSNSRIGATTISYNNSIEMCDRMVGHLIDDYPGFHNYLEKIRTYYLNRRNFKNNEI